LYELHVILVLLLYCGEREVVTTYSYLCRDERNEHVVLSGRCVVSLLPASDEHEVRAEAAAWQKAVGDGSLCGCLFKFVVLACMHQEFVRA
jgi:hypothetical protein